MRLSIWPGIERPYAEIVEMSQHAASTGWDGVYLADHFMPNVSPGEDDSLPMLECGSLIAALGALVPRVRIGTLVYGITYRHPAVLANMAATVDHITGGRFVFGVGAGWQLNEHAQYGIELGTISRRIDRFVEALQVLRGLLREPRYSLQGTYYQITDAVCEPKPVQTPMPILIGAKGEQRMLKIVAEYADIWNAWGEPDLIAHKSAVIDRYCASLGRDPSSIERTAQAMVVLNGEAPAGGGHPPVIGGSPEALADAIARYREIGLDELIIPDDTLGSGAELLKAMDTILSLR
jgi:alkanesulfonate monooxygenase SsuD/methylene tetrahydromethanopterin reductase-like flavin-dependent oxidoreductase (luciferase family)